MKKNVLSIFSLIAGAVALFYIVFARSLTLANAGMDVPHQLVAQRVIVCIAFIALFLLPFGVAHLADRLPSNVTASRTSRFLKIAAIVILPIVITFMSLQTPFWSVTPPEFADWNRPRFLYGWMLPWKSEAGSSVLMFMPCVNWLLWTLYFQWLFGCRRLRSFLTTTAVVGGISLLLLFVSGILPSHAVANRSVRSEVHAQ